MAIQLKQGYNFSFRNKKWKVTESYQIQWNDGTKSSEFKVKSNTGDVCFLEIENEGGSLHYSFWEKEAGAKISIETPKNEPVEHVFVEDLKFPKKILFKGTTYTFQKRYDGNFSDGYETEVVNSLDYWNEDESKLMSIEVWEDETEFSTGFYFEESEITNIEVGKASTLDSTTLGYIKKGIGIFVVFFFFVIAFSLSRCSCSGSSTSNGYNDNDSTRVHRSNNVYRSRNTSGFGK